MFKPFCSHIPRPSSPYFVFCQDKPMLWNWLFQCGQCLSWSYPHCLIISWPSRVMNVPSTFWQLGELKPELPIILLLKRLPKSPGSSTVFYQIPTSIDRRNSTLNNFEGQTLCFYIFFLPRREFTFSIAPLSSLEHATYSHGPKQVTKELFTKKIKCSTAA